MMPCSYVFPRHRLSALFPDLPSDEMAELAASIRAEGLRHPIILAGNGDGRAEVLDGWHRYVAAQKAGHQFEASDFRRVGVDRNRLIEIVKAENLDRRHLTPSQRAGVLAALYDGKWAMRGDGRPEGADTGNVSGVPARSGITEAEAAAEAGVSDRTMRDAKTAEAGGLGDAVRTGELSANEAARRVRHREGNAAAEGAKGSPTDGRPEAPRRPTAIEKLQDRIASLEGVIEAVEKRAYAAEAALENAEERAAVAIEGQADGPAREVTLNGVQADRDKWKAEAVREKTAHKETQDELKTARARIKHLERELKEARDMDREAA